MARVPLVAIVTYGKGRDPERYTLPVGYVESVRRAGARPLLVPPGEPSPGAILDLVDALLLPGGGDLDPALYGQAPHTTLYGIDPERDRLEVDLARAAIERRFPTLAVCRGLQVLNVALGGSLVQHLPDRIGEAVLHRADGGVSVRHPVRLDPASRLASICGASELDVASLHHQGADLLGERLRPVAWAPDGTVEAVELEDHPEIVAVQWHPELTSAADPTQQRLFDWLIGR